MDPGAAAQYGKAIVSSLIVILWAPGFYELVSKPLRKAVSSSSSGS